MRRRSVKHAFNNNNDDNNDNNNNNNNNDNERDNDYRRGGSVGKVAKKEKSGMSETKTEKGRQGEEECGVGIKDKTEAVELLELCSMRHNRLSALRRVQAVITKLR